MFSSKIRKVLATVLVIAMTVTSAGFNTLAASVTRVTNVKSEVDTERQKGLSYKYYEQFKSESVRLLMNGDEADDSGTTLQGGGEKQDTPSVKNVDDASEKDDAGVGAKNSSTDDENKTTSDDSSSLNENKDDDNKDDNKDSNKDDNKKDDKIDNVDDKGSTQNSGTTLDEQKEDTNDDISSPSDAEEEGEGEDKSSEEEPEEDGQEKNKKSDDGNSEEETASTSETEKNDGGDADDETTATNSDVNEENNKFDLGEIIMQLGDGNLLGANGDGADQYIDSYLWDKIKNCGATEIYFLNESEWNSAPGTVQALDGSRLWWREDSNAVRTETSLQAIAHPGSIDHGGTVMWEFDSTGHALKVKVDGTKYYFGPKQKVNFHVSHWGTYYGKWDANAFKSSFAINSGNVTSVSYTGNAVYGLYAPSSASMKDFPNVKKMVLKELKLQDASGVGLFKDLTNLEELVLGSSIINSTNDLTELFSGCTKLKSVTLPSSIGNNITSIASMFKNCSALTSVTFGSVALSSIPVDATSMFEGCTSLTNINFGSVDLTKISNATKMFKNCSKLEKIWVNAVSCKVKDTATSDNMFENCQKLEGYNGTKFDSTKTNYEYAHVDLDAWPGYFTTDDNVVNDATVDMKIIMEKTSGVRVERTIKALKAYTYADFTSKYLNPIVKESGYEKVTKSYSEGFGKFICSDPNYSGDDIIVRFANVINNSKIDISDKTLGYNGYLTFLVYVNSSDITWILGSDVHWADGYVASKSYIRGKKFILPTDKDIIKEGYYLEGWLISDKDGNHDEIITEFELEEGDVKLVPEFRKGPMTLWFGTYPQNDATGVQQEPIKWRKINENGSEALYVAEDILDNVSFHTSDGEVTWADSNMHTWLNDTFKEKAFTNNQIDEAIINKTINTSGSVDTTDKVFVLSYDEANNYFADNSERIAEATNYAKNVDNGGDKITVSDGKADWWLRTFGTSNGSINVVSSNGELDESGINPTYTKNGVRPALYLDLDSTLFRSYNNTITWNLGDELSWADNSTLWGEMTTYQGGQELPAQNNLATDRFLYGWKINDGEGIYKEIPENQTGNITLTPIFDTAPGTIWYGTYPQNDSTGKQIEPIKWRKLIENGGSEAVYVAENILDNVSYNKDNENTTWADSSIYSWLNDTSSAGFAGKAFTSNQLDNSLSIVKDKELVTSGSANINGKVNLLSLDDAQNLFKNDANRKASATAYAKAINNNGSVLTVNGGYSNWWLRSPGSEQMSNAAVIGFDGTINSNGSVVNASEIGVRPVLYVDITSETFKYDGNKVTWDLGSATWAAGSTLWGQMTNYQCGQALPKYNNLNIDKFLIGWKINNSTEVYTEIPNNQTGDITLTPVYGDAPDTLWLGLYPQNDVKGELLEPIKWRKLSQNGRSALYISDKVIDHVLYNDVNADVEWDTCTLHSWLNDSSATGFLGKTLTSIQFDDKTSILKPTELVTGQSIHTTDKVFLLNLDDTKNTDLFATKDDLKGMATEYTKAVKRNGKLIETSTSGYVRWWLRASYAYKNYSLYVTTNGGDSSGPAYYENQGLRPAINIDFESPLFRCTDNNLTWDLGDGMTWADRSTLWGEMTTYQGGQKLPTDDNLSVKYGYKLDGWFINGDRTATYSEIPSNQTGDITLTANWVAQNDENFATYKIKWELGAGANWVDGYKPITSYVSGWKTSLPTNADVVKNHYVLEGWYINDDVIVDTVIPSDQTGNITLKAKWTCDDYYVIPFKWYKNDLTGHEPTEVTAVHILRYPDIVPGPHGISASYEIEGSNGLMVYYTNTNEVYIYAPQDKPIYTPEDGRYLFGAGRGSSTVNSRFSSVTTITGLDLLDTSKTKDMAGMFYYMAKLKSIDISSFDTFNVTSMKKMFYRDYELESINFGTIHTKNVTDMESMFEDNNKLKTLDLKGFNTQKLTSMDYMFRNCNELTTIYATKNFVTTAITSTKTVFSGCSKLKGSDGTTYSDEHTDASYAWIDGLDEKPGYFYSDVNGEDCYILPRGWFSFDLAGRNPSQVKRIEIIKSQTPQINADILKKWDIPGSGGLTAYYTIDNVVYIYATNDYPIYTAKDSTSLFYPGGGAADSPSEGTFKNLEVIKGLDLLDTSRTTNMTYMFMDLQKITSLDLSSFDTSNVTSMQKMFGQCYALESIDLSNFDTSNVTTMSAMFEGDKELKVLDLRSFKTPNLTNMYSMFTSCEELTTIYVTKDFVTTALESTNNIFYGCSKLVGSNDTHYSEYHTDASYAWIDGLDGKPGYFSITVYTLPKTWITGTTENSSGVTTDEMKAVTTLTISRYPEVAPANYDKTWDIVDSDGLKGYLKGDEAIVYAEESSVIYLPEDCGEFFTPATYDTSKNVFDKVKVINNLSLLKTKKVTNMSHMFANMNELESVDLSNFDTSNVTDMEYMFSGIKEVKTLNLGKFDTTNVTNMTSMFEGCDKLEDILVDGTKFVTTNVTESSDMFKDCVKLTGRFGSRYTNVIVTGEDHGFGNRDVSFAHIDEGWASTNPGYFCDVTKARVPAFWRNSRNNNYYFHPTWTHPDTLDGSLSFAPGWYEEIGFTTDKKDITLIAVTNKDGIISKDNGQELISEEGATEIKDIPVYEGDVQVCTYSFILKGTELYLKDGKDKNGYHFGTYMLGTNIEDISGLFEGFESVEKIYDTGDSFEESISGGDRSYGALDIGQNTRYARNVFKDCHKLKFTNLNFGQEVIDLEDMEGMFENCYELPDEVFKHFFRFMNKFNETHNKVKNLKNAFKNCHALTKLDLSKFDTSETTDMTSMFEGCDKLEDILVDGTKFVTTNVTESSDMFKDCVKLTGRFGSRYTNVIVTGEDHGFGNRDVSFAHIDEGWASTNPGYFCDVTKPRVPAFWRNNKDRYNSENWDIIADGREGFLGFAPGWYEELGFTLAKENVTAIIMPPDQPTEENATEVKYVYEYLGNDQVATYSFILKGTELYVSDGLDANGSVYKNAFYFATNIEDVSGLFEGFTNLEKICDGSYDYYNLEIRSGTVIGLNTKYARNLFKDCNKLSFTNVGINRFATELIDVEGMFENCYALTSDTVNNFFRYMNSKEGKSTKLVNMKNMFKNCQSLTTLNLVKFDTSLTTDMTSMFEGCSNLSAVMVSDKFVTTSVTASENMFNECTVLSGAEGTSYAEFGNRNAAFAIIDKGEAGRGYLSELLYVLKKGWYSVDKSQVQPFYVNKIRFASFSEVISSYETTWSVDDGLKAYTVSLGTTPARYEVVIKGDEDRKIYAPTDSSYLFSYLLDADGNKLEAYGFNNVTVIENIEYLDTRKVATASHMFDNMGNITSLDLSKNVWLSLRDTSYMFNDNVLLETLKLSNFDTKNVSNMEYMFNSCRKLTAIDVTNFDTANVENMKNMFYNVRAIKELDISNFNTEEVMDMSGMFYGIGRDYAGTDEHIELNLSNFNTSNVTNMASMFSEANVATLSLVSFDTSKVISMSGMFAMDRDLQSLTLGDSFDTSNVTNMSYMFYLCSKLDVLDVSKFNTSKVTNMASMFTSVQVETLDVSGFDTSNVTNISGMFSEVAAVGKLDLSNFNTSKVTDMSDLFRNCYIADDFELDLKSFDTSKVTNMNFMFAFSHRLTRIKVGSKFVTTNVNSSDYMFGELDNLRGSLGTTLASTSYIIDKTYARIDGGVAAPGYFSGDAYIVTFDAMDGYFPSKSVGENKETIATASVYVGTLIDSIKPENPVSNRGYEFVGWRVRGGAIQDGAYAFDYDATFEAVYDSDEKTKVRLNTGVGTFANGDNERITYMAEGDDTGRFERPVAEGYTFDEYYVNDEVLKATWSYASNDEVEVVAKYIPNNYRIIFNGNGATSGAMAMEIATYGETHILSKNQFENDGYDFGGWFFIDEDGQHNFIDEGEAYNLTSVKDGEIKLTAVWEPKRTVIHYESNGATITLSDSDWNALFGTEDSSENTPETMTEGDGLFGREYDTNMSPTNMFYNSQETLSPNRYYRPGYEFEGWALSPDTAAIYFDQSEIGRDENYQEDINLYAKWKPKKEIAAKLILDGNGGTINGAQRSEINLSYGEYLPQVTIENPGYELDYWENTYKIFGIITIRIRCEFPEFCDFFGERTLTAHWKPIKYTLRLNENFGDNEYYDIEATYGEEPDISLYTVYTGLKRTNARFTGWSTEQDSEGGIYLNTSSAYPSGVQKGGILNLYAIWNKPKYSIRLHGIDPSKPLEDDDNIHYQVFEYEKNEQLQGIKYTIATINNVKAEFIGWTYDPYLQNPDGQLYSDACIADRIYEDVLAKGVNFPLDYVNVKQIELWPKWTNKLNSSYIIFDGNGGTIEGSKIKTFTYTAGNMIQAPDVKDIYRKGYELDLTNPWVDKDGNVFTETTAKPDGEIHLYANWKQKTYDIEYVGIGDETILVSDPNANSIKKTMQGGEEFVVPDGDMFERPGYDFLGWDTKVAANTVVYKPGQTVDALGDADETVKLYTVWQPRVYTIYYYDGDDSLIGTNSFIFTKKVRVLPNEGITEGNQDAGFTYEVNGEVKKFSSGQSLNAEDFEIVAVEKEKILSDVAQRNNNLLGNVGGFFNNLFGDREDTVPAERKSPLLGDPGSGGGIVLKGNTAKQIYNLTFDANGGQFPDGETVKTATASTGDDMSAKWPPQPTNTTDFVGWAIELDDGTNIEYTDTTYTLTESITFKAKWASGYYARLLANGGVYSDGSIEQRIPMRKDEATNKFEIPTRTGYDFDNYYVRTVAGEEVLTANWNYFANEVTDVVAHWIPYNYRVVYDANGGTGYMPYEIATVGETYTFASNKFAKDGYRFDGWYVEVLGTTVNEGVDVSDLTLVKNGTVTVKATWAPLTYDVVYHANEGVGVMTPELDITYGVPHKLKANAFTKADHTFRGWSLATGSDITYFDKATISETTSYKPEINLYAEWLDNNEIYGTLKLHGNGGLINGSDDIVLPLRYLEPLSEPELEKTGYKFTNWTDNTGNVVTYPTECNFKELELTANWTPIKYNVRYFANGGTFTNGVKDFIDDNDKEYDDKFYLKSTTDISRVRYTFNGWKLTNATGERILGAGSEQENLTSIDGERVDLYAEWVGDTYTVTLHQIDPAGSALAANTVSNFTYGNNESLGYIANKIATVSDIGYEFSGWAVPTDRNRIKYFASQKADVVYETEGTNSIELYPVWVRRDKLVYVTFDGNGGTVNGANKWVVPFATGSELVYPISENVKRKGYNHTGWLDSDKTTPFNKTIVDFNENKTIYAEWAPGNYTIEYVAVGGNGVDDIIEGTMGSDTKTTAGKTTLTSNAYERIGYTFVGWDTNPDAKVAIYGDAEPDLEPLGDIGDVVRLYTVWKANEYTITYKDVAGNVIGTNVLTYGSTVTLLANTNIPIGQKDTGFELEGHPDVKFISGQTVTGIDLKIDKNTNLLTGLVLNGTTEKIVYIITFDANGGTFPDGRTVASSSITYGDPVAPKVPGNPTYGVKAFTGYTVDGAYRDVTTLTYNYTSSKTFFANWDGKLFKIEYAKNTPVSPDTTKVNTVTGATMATQSALANKNTRINPNSWNVVGYTFVGWATASYTAKVVEQMRDALDPRIIGDQGEINWDRAEGEVVTLYAMWARNKYRLTVAQNEDTTKSNIRDPFATSSYIYFDELLSDNAAFAPKTRTNYTFQNKWTDARIAEPYARKNYTGTNYYTTASVYRRTSDLLIYPLWTNDERVITLNLDPNEAELPSGYTKNTFVGYIDAPLNTLGASDEPKLQDGRLVTPIATPYDMKIFNYWSTTKGDSTTKVDPNKIYDGTFTTIYANVRFREEYALTYDPNGGTGFMAADTMKEGIKKDLQPNAYKKNGYVFGGWYDQYGAYHGNGTSIDNPSGPLYLSANWGKINNGGNGPSGGGGGGGGGGRQAAGSIQSDLEDGFSMQTPILLNEYTWTKDAAGLPNGVLLRRSSTLAKALLNSSDHSSRYKIVAGDNDNIVLKNGFYSIQREDGSYFYLLDKDGNIKTGFVNVDKLILSNVNTNTYTIEKIGEADGGKYYLLEESSYKRGQLYNQPITLNGVKYLFDDSGRITSETAEGNAVAFTGSDKGWRYDPVNNTWSYYAIDNEGKVNTYRDGAYPIAAADNNTYYYVFDENGLMKTGFVEYNGNTYYLREEGALKGSVYTGTLTLNNKNYIFDASGAMVTALSHTEEVNTEENRFIP